MDRNFGRSVRKSRKASVEAFAAIPVDDIVAEEAARNAELLTGIDKILAEEGINPDEAPEDGDETVRFVDDPGARIAPPGEDGPDPDQHLVHQQQHNRRSSAAMYDAVDLDSILKQEGITPGAGEEGGQFVEDPGARMGLEDEAAPAPEADAEADNAAEPAGETAGDTAPGAVDAVADEPPQDA